VTGPARRSLGALARRVVRRPAEDDDTHPERLAVLAHLEGTRVVEVGCGPRKTAPHAIGIDLVPGGQPGRHGNAAGRVSQADLAGDGGALPLRSGVVDCLVARHNLEHYVDLVGTLREWHRVLRAGGRLVAVVPDEARYPGRTLELDPTHYHAFDEAFLSGLLPLVGFSVDVVGPCIEGWSLLVVASANGDAHP
jgi:SAM-dependent methyltransferase